MKKENGSVFLWQIEPWVCRTLEETWNKRRSYAETLGTSVRQHSVVLTESLVSNQQALI